MRLDLDRLSCGNLEGRPAPRTFSAKHKKSTEQMQEERRQKELASLADELAAAPAVIPFDPRRRYRAGEIIEHTGYGRGKIETALKSSIVVRFATGRRSLILK